MAEPGQAAAAMGTDPRQDAGMKAERDVRPVVQRARAGLSGPAIGGLAAIAGLGLFGILEARRQSTTAPATMAAYAAPSTSTAPPPLYIPPVPPEAPAVTVTPLSSVREVPVSAPVRSSPAQVSIVPNTQASASPPSDYSGSQAPTYSAPSTPVRQPPRNVSGQALIVDSSSQESPGTPEAQNGNDAKGGDNKRVSLSTTRARAAMLANRATTVPQGTLIPAVLETAFDSTSPGFARALVQKNIYGFDGTQILIPRGSRLIGEYGADTARGQRRAVILWSRLIRPDGVTIAIGSPAADTLGRGGVAADVNSHFLERFSGAILQSALDVGVNLAARNSRSPVIVALPSTGSAVSNIATARTNDITPTLRVPAGRSVSVFVSRDLDFTAAGAVR